jgi:kynurenine formamidase
MYSMNKVVKRFRFVVFIFVACTIFLGAIAVASPKTSPPLWQTYEQTFKSAKYVDLTHRITPSIPVWSGFAKPQFSATVNPATGKAYTYKTDGFEATHYDLPTDQLGTQLDPPAHWNPDYPAIDELPPTFTLRPLVVIPIQSQVAKNPNYALQIADILAWEKKHQTRIPEGSVVFVRSDWSKDWPNPDLAKRKKFPGVSLSALKFLHQERHILFHGHEPLDTDSTPTLEGESWLLNNGYTQAEGVANLAQVPEIGALVAIGFPKFQGGLGGYARFIAICPPSWPYGVSVGELPESPLAKASKPLRWDENLGFRVR